MGSGGEDFRVHKIFGIFENVNFLEVKKTRAKEKRKCAFKRAGMLFGTEIVCANVQFEFRFANNSFVKCRAVFLPCAKINAFIRRP